MNALTPYLTDPEPPRRATLSRTPESVVMNALNRYLPGAYDAVRSTRRALRFPSQHANPFGAMASLLGLGEPLGMVEGPARAVGPLVRGGKQAADALSKLNKAPSVAWGMEPEWVSESRGFPRTGAPGSIARRRSEGSVPAEEVFAFDSGGNLVGVLSQALEGSSKGALKVTVREDARRQGWGTKLLDEARRAGMNVEESIETNRFTPEGRSLFRAWLQK